MTTMNSSNTQTFPFLYRHILAYAYFLEGRRRIAGGPSGFLPGVSLSQHFTRTSNSALTVGRITVLSGQSGVLPAQRGATDNLALTSFYRGANFFTRGMVMHPVNFGLPF